MRLACLQTLLTVCIYSRSVSTLPTGCIFPVYCFYLAYCLHCCPHLTAVCLHHTDVFNLQPSLYLAYFFFLAYYYLSTHSLMPLSCIPTSSTLLTVSTLTYSLYFTYYPSLSYLLLLRGTIVNRTKYCS